MSFLIAQAQAATATFEGFVKTAVATPAATPATNASGAAP
jgi:hypothetical protein